MARDIRTPDQRVRVFISSTLGELASERDAVRRAIEALRLTPVMFESNARHHPPRDVYRAYLEQSEVFIGVYWQRYGWIVPGSDLSGIEDEYLLAGDRPRLIYVKEPASDRDARLAAMLAGIETDGQTSYRIFGSIDELTEAVSNDLSLLLSERFTDPPARRHVGPGVFTFLFCDIEGSTRLLERLGDGYDDVQRRYHAIVADAVASHGGVLEDRTGDGTFSVFGDPMSAVRCAVAIETTLAGEPWPMETAPRPRIGMHTGSALDRPEGWVGLDVHRAARIGDAAQGGQILLSSVTADLVAEHVQRVGWVTQDLGEFGLRGVSRPERLFALLVPGFIDDAPSPRARRINASAIPVPLSSLIGRDREVEQLTSLLRRPEVRLVTVTGPGGIGKTRIAQAAAAGLEVDHAYPDGVAWIALDTVGDASLVPDRVAQELGLLDAGRQAIIDTITEFLSDRSMLVVLDNFEQVSDAAPFVGHLLSRAPGVTVLVTSRSPLRIQGEAEMPVDALEYPELSAIDASPADAYPAVELFVARARAANPLLDLTGDRLLPVVELVTLLEGVPLAIELAAAHARYLDPETLLARMTDMLDMLAKGPRDLPERHRTMRATIAWSESLLDDERRKLFHRLSVFRGSASLSSIASVTNWDGSLDADPLEGLEELADAGLIRFTQRHGTGESEITMLRVVREYGRAALDADGDGATTERAHAEHVLAFVEEAEPVLMTPGRRPWLERLERCLPDVEAAFGTMLANGDHSGLWRLTASIGPYLFLRGPYGRALQLVEDAGITAHGDLPAGISPMLGGRALRSVGTVMFLAGRLSAAVEHLRRSVELIDVSGDELEAARARAFLGVAGLSAGDPSTMVELAAARETGERLDDLLSFALATTFSAEVALAMGDVDGARQLLDVAEQRSRKAGDGWLVGLALMGRGNLSILADDAESGIEVCAECHELLSEEQPPVSGWPLVGSGYCAMLLGRLDEARTHHLAAMASGRRSGDKAVVIGGMIGVAWTLADTGETADAARLMGAADAIAESIGYRLWTATAHLRTRTLEALSANGDPVLVERCRSEGALLSYEEALALATVRREDHTTVGG